MVKFYKEDCAKILSQIKREEKLLNLKRRWLMGLSTSKSKKKQLEEPKFFKYKTLPESFLREDDVFYERIKTRIEEAFGAHHFKRGSHVSQDSDKSFDAAEITGSFLSSLEALTNNGLYIIALVLTGCPRSFEKTRRKMKQVIKASFPSLLDSKNHTCQQKETITRLYRALKDPQNFRGESMKSVTPTFQGHRAAAIDVLNGLENLPYLALVAMDRKFRCLRSVPQLQAGGQETKRTRLIKRVRKTAKTMLSNLEKGGELPEPLAKALAVADLSVKLTTGCQNTSAACFYQFSPEIINLQNEIVKAILILKTKIRFPELKTLKALLDPDVEISSRSLRGAINNMLTEFLFECSDMDTVPKSLLETLALINKDSRSMPQGQFLKEVIEEEVECILSVSAQMKQIFWDSLPDYEFDEQFADAYMEELEESDDGSCIADNDDGSDGQEEDTESCMSHSVNSIERDENKSNIKVDPEYISSNEKGSTDINHVKSISKLHVSTDGKCFTPFSLRSGEINDYSIERDEVKQNIGVDLENASICSPNVQLGSEMFVHNKSRMCRNQYLTTQEACDETSLVAYDLIGHLLEKFMKEQDMDLDRSDSLYLRGVSLIQEDTQEKQQKRPMQDAEDSFTQIINKLMPPLPKSAIERLEELMATN